MTTLSNTTISEQLLKLKSVLENGQSDGTNQTQITFDLAQSKKPAKKPINKKKMPQSTSHAKPSVPSVNPYAKSQAMRNTDQIDSAQIDSATSNEQSNEKGTQHLQRKIRPSENPRIIHALKFLYAQFPAAFKKLDKIPLKIGIFGDIVTYMDEQQIENAPSRKAIRDALTLYTRNVHYQKAVLDNTKRHNLQGEEVQDINDNHKEYAEERHTLISDAITRRQEMKKARMVKRGTAHRVAKKIQDVKDTSAVHAPAVDGHTSENTHVSITHADDNAAE